MSFHEPTVAAVPMLVRAHVTLNGTPGRAVGGPVMEATARSGNGVRPEVIESVETLFDSPVLPGLYSKTFWKMSAVTVMSRPPAPLTLLGRVKL